MSCGDPHETDCSEVLAQVWLFLDHECDQERRALLARHLDECSPCLAQYGIDEAVKRLLASRCGGELAPAEFKERLRRQIRVAVMQQAQVTVESGPEGTTVEVRTTEVRATRVERRS
ncbi:mycothiol system anti-sigma-R factor [Pseudonocardia sp.]|uniref:mycothiol system anti-sigma-R factor n=1 Tax=Pseudonocardia sp. TaxID=60912 RepID=UPI003D148BD6